MLGFMQRWELNPFVPEFRFENSVLLLDVGDYVELMPVHPTCQAYKEPLPRLRYVHLAGTTTKAIGRNSLKHCQLCAFVFLDTTGDRIPKELEFAKIVAHKARMEVNRARTCPTCVPLT